MTDKKLTFSVNQHDSYGDSYDDCVLLHVNDDIILRFDSADQLEKFADDIKNMLDEIKSAT